MGNDGKNNTKKDRKVNKIKIDREIEDKKMREKQK